MRALLIGLGGAGCRIVETLNRHDEKSNVKSVRSYAFDADTSLIHSMKSLEVQRRVVLSPSDPLKPDYEGGDDFDLSGVGDCFHEDGFGDIDGFFVCAGLGGRMADLLPRFMAELETIFPDPVFSILTLPRRSEGVKVSTRAAEQLEAIRAMGSACIIFDNETWASKLSAEEAAKGGLKEGDAAPVSHRETTDLYDDLNELLARRVGLLLRAGEVTHNGVESAEVVLDAGEVLNTLTGMDIVSIGYATEKLPKSMTGVFKRMFVEKYMLDEGHQRTSRIIDLAKKAVYEEVSIPCDLTSADKALVLIAVPSEELSMKGFQMVRKWIDTSIRGIEMRAGDYPVKSTQYVGVIIVLAGIQNVPRIAELEEIRASYYQEVVKVYDGFEIEEEDIPRLAVASDDSIFEPGEVLPPGDYVYALPEMVYEDEAVVPDTIREIEEVVELHGTFEDAMTDDTAYEEDDDLFEDTPVLIQKKPAYQPPRAAPPTRSRVHDPQISLGGAQRVEKTNLSTISMPKREKKEDMVLSGMADLGSRRAPNDAERVVRIGGTDRPKEIDDAVVKKVQRPKDHDTATIKQVQRPKDSDGAIRITRSQIPKEDTELRVAKVQRPKDGDGAIRMPRVPMPKTYSEQVKVSAKKRSKEDDPREAPEYRWL